MTIEIGSKAPNIALNDAAEDKPFDLSEALGRGPVIVGIYKSSCEASKTMFRALELLRQAYPAEKLTIWGVAQDSPNVTRSFIRRIGISFPMLVEGDQYPVSQEYAIEATPTVFLIDGDGNVVWESMGFQKAAFEELNAKVAECLGTAPADLPAEIEDLPGWVPG
jgi:peroxiredoxin